MSQSSRDQRQTGMMAPFARDMAAVVSLGILLVCVHEYGTPFIRGFHCDDETIRYPHKSSTVSSLLCYLAGSGLNLFIILFFEYRRLVDDAQNSRENQSGFSMKLYIRNVYCRLVVWFFGSIASELLTDISKVTAGRLRPHFIDVCRPIVFVRDTQMDLNSYCKLPESTHKYITDYRCSDDVGRRERDTRLSFMSGHSSYSAYSAAHAVLYLQSAMELTKFGLIKPAVQVLIASAAFYTGLTRISDYKHHWQDVLAGLTQGTSVAIIMSLCLWPVVYKTYSKIMKITGPRVANDHVDQELNRVSY